MNVRLHHVVDGPPQGPVVLLGGSLASDLTMWRPQVPALLAAGFRVVRFDHRGHGRSPVRPGPYDLADLGGDVLALLDSLGVARAHYVGLSLGGMVGMWLAGQAPARLGNLVLCCTSAYLGPPEGWAARAAAIRSGGPHALAETTASRWFTDGFAAANPELMGDIRKMIAGTPAAGCAAGCEVIGRMDLRAALAGISSSTLVISGAQDVSTPVAHGRLIASLVPGARFEVVDPGAHLLNIERPDVVNRLVVEHLLGS